jgi:S1-C subfamily serine protease
VNVAGIERVADYVAEVAGYLAAEETGLTFRPAGAEHLVAKPGETRRRVSFGSIPDFSKESGGILLSGVMPGGAAEEAGLLAGDVLVEIDGVTIDTIHDFQRVLAEHDPGDRVPVRYVRDGETHACEVVLRERK